MLLCIHSPIQLDCIHKLYSFSFCAISFLARWERNDPDDISRAEEINLFLKLERVFWSREDEQRRINFPSFKLFLAFQFSNLVHLLFKTKYSRMCCLEDIVVTQYLISPFSVKTRNAFCFKIVKEKTLSGCVFNVSGGM